MQTFKVMIKQGYGITVLTVMAACSTTAVNNARVISSCSIKDVLKVTNRL